jgi:hypothetical protein
MWCVLAGSAWAVAPLIEDNHETGGLRMAITRVAPEGVQVVWNAAAPRPSRLLVYRSTTNFGFYQLDATVLPISRFEVAASAHGQWLDTTAADGTTYFYQIKAMLADGRVEWSNMLEVTTPPRLIPDALTAPSLWISKPCYTLELRDGDRLVKRYPVALGRNPVRRKLHQDNSSTPEGTYRICGVQPNAEFYRAYDVSYPNRIDQLRYHVARQTGQLPSTLPDIGGEIQIHGQGILKNWTYGCIALRNEDMDELFLHPEIRSGVSLTIVGSELRAEDVVSIRQTRSASEIARLQQALRADGDLHGNCDGAFDDRTRQALGYYQWRHHLPMTCELDARTVTLLGRSLALNRRLARSSSRLP